MRRVLLAVAVASLALAAAAAGGGARRSADVAAYQGLGTWISIFGTRAYTQPATVAAAIASRGVRTVYVETGNFSQPVDVVRARELGVLVDALHERGLRVVAWYLPGLVRPDLDFRRALAAIRFQTPSGGAFDGFALDIESAAVKRPARRTARLLALSRRLRAAVGPDQALAAIIPAPRGMQLLPRYWPDFPYAQLAELYDVFLPMVYWTFSVKGPDGTYGYLAWSLATLRAATGRPDLPIHVVGGTSDRASVAEERAFAQLVADDGRLVGWSLFDWFGTKSHGWRALAAIPQPAAG